MKETPAVQTQPEPEHLARAGDLLEAVLLGDLDPDARLTVGGALAVLYDVFPPVDPRPQQTAPLPLDDGLDLALKSLTAAVDAADTVQEALRAGLAARELTYLRDRR